MFQELSTTLKFTDLSTNHVFHTAQKFQHHNNAKKRLKNAKSTKFLIIVSPNKSKTSSNKFSITVQLSLSFQFTEISSFTTKVFIKCTQETKDSQLAKP